jgi:small subunit ribosomal protein S1
VVNTYNVGDVLEGKVTKVVSFGAFVEIMEGVEGLVHISELAQHHVENPREIVDPGDEVKVKILEIDDERRRLSLSLKRVEGQVLPMREIAPSEDGTGQADEEGEVGDVPDLDLSEEVFSNEQVPDEPAGEPRAADQEGEAAAPPDASAGQGEPAEQEAGAEQAEPSSEQSEPS